MNAMPNTETLPDDSSHVVKAEFDNTNGLVRQRSHSVSSHHHHHHHVAEPVLIKLVSNKYLGQILLHLILAFFGIVGVLIRASLDRLTTFKGSQYGGVLWSNFAGCLIMGMLIKSKDLFSELILTEHREGDRKRHRIFKAKGEIPLYVGLATGGCGSITSFSSFMISLYEFSSVQPSGVRLPNPGYGVMVFLSYLIVTLAVSFSGFFFGQHLIEGIEKNRKISLANSVLFIELVLAGLGLVGWIVVVVLSITEPSWRYWTFCCVFGPFGVYARFWFGKLLNGKSKTFLLGTFAANMFATIIISILVILQHGKRSGSESLLIGNVLHCQVITALEDGFCGNFSTISTFISELSSLRKRNAYFYGGFSIASGFSIVILIVGSYSWTIGLSELSAC